MCEKCDFKVTAYLNTDTPVHSFRPADEDDEDDTCELCAKSDTGKYFAADAEGDEHCFCYSCIIGLGEALRAFAESDAEEDESEDDEDESDDEDEENDEEESDEECGCEEEPKAKKSK